MLLLETEYIAYLCQIASTINSVLMHEYLQYCEDSYIRMDNNFYCDNELTSFLLNLINDAEYWTDVETAINMDLRVRNYYRLKDLVQYMHQIDNLAKKNKFELSEAIIDPILCNYQLCDSRLDSFIVDNIKHKCSITLDGVIFYHNDKTRTREGDQVDSVTITIRFKNTVKVDMKGQIAVHTAGCNRVYLYHQQKSEDGLTTFCMLVLDRYQPFLVQLTYSNIEVETLSTEPNPFLDKPPFICN